jgi:limonene-1,2-epoxide hydrolase
VADLLTPESIVRGLFAALNERDYGRAAGAIAEKCEWWSMPSESLHRGPGAVVAGLREFTGAFPDWRAEVDRVVASGPLVVVEWVSTGTFERPFRGRAPNGRAFRRRGCSVAEVRQSQIVHYRDYFDRAALFQQLDLMDLL